jgi:hypothetical protein
LLKNVTANFSTNFKFKISQNLKLAKQKSPRRWQLITFAWLILNFWQILNLKFGEKFDISHPWHYFFNFSSFILWILDSEHFGRTFIGRLRWILKVLEISKNEFWWYLWNFTQNMDYFYILFSIITINKFTAWRGVHIIPKRRLELNNFVWFLRSLVSGQFQVNFLRS